jgi:hypothetical protein
VGREWFVKKLASMGMGNEQTNVDGFLCLKNVLGEGCISKVWEEVRTEPGTTRTETYSELLSATGLGLFFGAQMVGEGKTELMDEDSLS